MAQIPLQKEVANRTEATFYRGTLTQPFECIKRLSNPKGRLTETELVSDKPGRGFSSAGEGSIHHSLDQRFVHHEKAARDFVKEIIENLKKIQNDEKVTDLILVAEPHFLGLLRNELPPSLRSIVKFEINRELSKMSADDLYQRIRRICHTTMES